MANQALKKLNYQIGRICRMGSRRLKLMAVNNRRKQQLRHLGERIYILKTLQQDDNIWEKDEISQLLLTIADLDQEIEMLIEEINEIKAENPPEDVAGPAPEEAPAAAPEPPKTEEKKPAAPAAAAPAEEKKTATKKAAVKKTEKKSEKAPAAAKSSPAKTTATKAAPKRKTTTKKSTAKSTKESK